MRMLVLSILALISIYAFSPKSEVIHQTDAVEFKQSAPRRKHVSGRKIQIPEEDKVELVESDESDPSSDGETDISSTADSAEVEHVEDAPADDHEKNWQDELSQVIVNLEPEYGEEMFNAYVSERNGYQTSLDELIQGNQKNQDLEYLIGELETKHDDRVKEIFGRHYEEIKDHQSKFLDSETP